MALTVEDGTGLADADALDSLANVKARWDAQGRDYSAYDDTADIEPAIRRGSFWLSDSFAWKGYRTNLRVQAFQWPRTGVVDNEQLTILSDEIPREILRALAEVAWQELVTPFSMNPVVTPINQKILTKVGEIQWTPLGNGAVEDSIPVITAILDIIGPLLAVGAGSRIAGTSVRI